jgi:cation transport regulator ChaB
VAGWSRVVAGVVLGVAGTVYATNEELRKQLPEAARDLPGNVRRRFESARSAAREASSRRREEILRDLERHDVAHAARVPRFASEEAGTEAVDPVPGQPTTDRREATERIEEESR